MSGELSASKGVADFARLWADSTARVLDQLHGSPFTTRSLEDAAPADAINITCKVSGAVIGEIDFELGASSAVRLSQLLMSEPLDATATLTDGHKDALTEVFRQFGGIAATAAKSHFGAVVEFEVLLGAAPGWSPSAVITYEFSAASLAPLSWRLLFSEEAAESIGAAALRSAQAAPTSANAGASSASADPAPSPAMNGPIAGAVPENLGLLLDVTLDAHLRFGQRQMLLREILDLRAGSVVELDRRLQEPAELLVSGRVIARGEVVIVDGSYGIRVTDIIQPQQRLTSLKA
jgi:flagellar motor switch protein FliN